MSGFWKKMKHFTDICLGLFPSRLPIGMNEFDRFCFSIFETYYLPDMPSYRHAIASMIMHLGPTTAYKSKWFFVLSVRKSMANQVAYENIQLMKKKEQEYIEKTMAKTSIEATHPASTIEPIQNQAI